MRFSFWSDKLRFWASPNGQTGTHNFCCSPVLSILYTYRKLHVCAIWDPVLLRLEGWMSPCRQGTGYYTGRSTFTLRRYCPPHPASRPYSLLPFRRAVMLFPWNSNRYYPESIWIVACERGVVPLRNLSPVFPSRTAVFVGLCSRDPGVV
jgi:hypothetical protein